MPSAVVRPSLSRGGGGAAAAAAARRGDGTAATVAGNQRGGGTAVAAVAAAFRTAAALMAFWLDAVEHCSHTSKSQLSQLHACDRRRHRLQLKRSKRRKQGAPLSTGHAMQFKPGGRGLPSKTASAGSRRHRTSARRIEASAAACDSRSACPPRHRGACPRAPELAQRCPQRCSPP